MGILGLANSILLALSRKMLPHVRQAWRVDRRVGEILHLDPLGLQACGKLPQARPYCRPRTI